MHPIWDAPSILRLSPSSRIVSAIALQVRGSSNHNGVRPLFGGTRTLGRSEELVGAEERLVGRIERVRAGSLPGRARLADRVCVIGPLG